MLVALDPRLPRAHDAEHIGNFWVDLTRSDALHPAAALARPGARPGLAGRGAELRTPYCSTRATLGCEATGPTTASRTNGRSPSRSLPMGPAASQIAIKQLGTNGGGFFNVNSAHPFENPTPLSNFLEMLAILLIPAALCYTFGKMVGDTRQGWAVLAAMTVDLRRRCSRSACGRSSAATRASPRSASTSTASDVAARRQHGRQGGPLRHRQLRPLGDRHDRRLERLGQLDARLVHAARRPRADVPDAARRGDLRRRRLGPLRHAGLRHRRRLRRRPDGRPHARVPRQEDRGLRDEDGLARHPDPAARRARLHRDRGRDRGRARRAARTPARTASARSSTPSARWGTTTAAPSPACRANMPFYNTARRHRDALRALLARDPDARDRRLARAEEARARRARARCRRTRRSSSSCWSASSSSSAR